MQIIIKTKNLELTPSLQSYVDKKLQGLEKFLPVASDLFLEIEKETNHHKKGYIFSAEAQIILPGKNLVAKAKSDDVFKAIIQAREELEREIKHYKTKTIEKPRRQAKKSRENIF